MCNYVNDHVGKTAPCSAAEDERRVVISIKNATSLKKREAAE